MQRIAISLALLGALLTFNLSEARAQNARSWVASTGSDSNSCTRSQPCATFTGAYNKTQAGGEINCADQGDFSGASLIIMQSVIIDCEGVQGRTTAASTITGITIVGGTNAPVVLRGLDITGDFVSPAGITINAGTVSIEKCVIDDISNSNFGGVGISIEPTEVPIVLSVSDTVIRNNGMPSNGAGIDVNQQVFAVTKIILNRVEVRNNPIGIRVRGTVGTNGGVVNMTIRDSTSAGNTSNGIVGTTVAGGPAIVMMIDRSASSHNGGFGILADGPLTTIRVGDSSIAGNATGVGVSNGGVLQSYGTNQINGNSNDGIASLTPIGLH
ncbi:MAG: hypothetical protein JOZ40_17400 [Methylobacteriaceae bacterium]|nr:hypothetical protein [Methylobacteriaceae bacterium]